MNAALPVFAGIEWSLWDREGTRDRDGVGQREQMPLLANLILQCRLR